MSFERFEILMLALVGVPILGMGAAGAVKRWRALMRAWGPAASKSEFGRAPERVRNASQVTSYAISWGLRAAALVFAIVALARPIYGEREVEVQRRGVDLLIALDVSRSMLAADPAPSRLEWAKREASDLLDELPGARIGLLSFAGTAFLQCPFTVDRETLRLFLDNVSPDYLPLGGSSIGEALAAAVDAFDPTSPADRAIIMLSDGEATSPGLEEAAEKVRASGVRLFILGIGGVEGAPVPAKGGGFVRDRDDRIVVSKLGEDALKLLARTTGGAYVRARSDTADTVAIAGEVRAKLKEAEFEDGVRTVPEDRYQWFLAPALLLWLLGGWVGERRYGTVGARVILPMLAALMLTASPARAETSFREAVREGQKAFAAGDYAKAAGRYGEAAVSRPEDPRPAFNRGVSLYEAGQFPEAVKEFEKITVGDAEQTLKETTWYNLGNSRYRANDLEGAVKAFEQALTIDAADEDARRNLEFVKKRLEEMQQQQQSGDGKDQDEGEEEKDRQQAGDKNGSNQQEQQDSPSESGQKQDSDAGQQQEADQKQQDSAKEEQQASGGENEQETAAGDEEQKDAQGKEQSTAGKEDNERGDDKPAAPASQIFGGEAGQRRAEALLERLQDRPGTALLPQYRERNVEKDW